MVWRLEIRHIGLDSAGDATLIRAINDGIGAHQEAQTRSVLIDGGLDVDHVQTNAYIAARLGADNLDVIVVTHYDRDHVRGITSLLGLAGAAANRYANTIIFDQGFSEGSRDNDYINYQNAIAAQGARSRVTRDVCGTLVRPFAPPAAPPPPGWLGANWLLGNEIMWTNARGEGRTPAEILNAAAGTNTGEPRITCISVNQYVAGAAGRQGGGGTDLKNQHSLGFIVQFNKFRYYIAGDLETAQETAVQAFVNPLDNLAGRVIAIHASHHGGNTSTQRAFLDRLKPDIAIISCGNENQHEHPSVQVLNVLAGYAWNGVDHADAPPPPPYRPIFYYLTGYGEPNQPPAQPRSHGEAGISSTAGNPQTTPRRLGHIALTVSEAQSQKDQRGEFYVGVREAARWAARGTGAGEPLATQIGAAAAEAIAAAGINDRATAAQRAAVAAATAASASANVSNAAGLAAWNEVSGNGPRGVDYTPKTIVEYTVVQTKINGGTPCQAASAAAAAAAAFASGQRDTAGWATYNALRRVGKGIPVAKSYQLQCLEAIAAGVGVGLFTISFYDFFRHQSGGGGVRTTIHYG